MLCLSRDDPDLVIPTTNQLDFTHFKYGCARARMWALYAQNHRGVCLEFDGDALEETVEREVGDRGIVFSGDVRYVDEWDFKNLKARGEAFQFAFEKLLGNNTAMRDHIKQHYQHYFLEKSLDWVSECEYRWLVHSSAGPFFVDIREALSGVIAGVDVPDVYHPSLAKLCRDLNTRLEKMSWNNRVPSKGEWALRSD